jgi:MHS family alpha-ketoglutarate permease-like MFS transporter
VSDQLSQQDRRRSLAAVTFGNTLEWYEWGTYGVFAPFIAAAMFNSTDPVSALLSTFAIYAIGFFMRPVGGIVFGRIADVRGRRTVLMVTLLMMGAGSFIIGFAPSYESVGVWASVILLAARLAQGFAHGGETATSYSYLSELAPADRRGVWSSYSFAALLVGTMTAFALGYGLIVALGESTVADWAWRVPFIIGGLFSLLVLVMRRRMHESELFSQQDSRDRRMTPAERSRFAKGIAVGLAFVCGLTVWQYTWLSFVPNYLIVTKGVSPSRAYLAMIGALGVGLVFLLLWGRLSDRIGRRPMIITWSIAVAVLYVPLFKFATGGALQLFIAASVAWALATMTGSLQTATMAEFFETRHRTLGIGLAMSISVALFGGTAPYLNQWLYARDLGDLSLAYVIVCAIATLVAGVIMQEAKGVDLSRGTSVAPSRGVADEKDKDPVRS